MKSTWLLHCREPALRAATSTVEVCAQKLLSHAMSEAGALAPAQVLGAAEDSSVLRVGREHWSFSE